MKKPYKKDHRRYVRIPFQRNIKYRLCYERLASEIIDADARNISQNGLLFKTKYPPPTSTIIALNIDITKLAEYLRRENLTDVIKPDQLFIRDHSIFGEVVRIIKDDKSGFYSVAVKLILKKDPLAAERIERARAEEHPQYIDPKAIPYEEKYAPKKDKHQHPQYIGPPLKEDDEEI